MQTQMLKVFADVADTGSFSRAAELNGITQSAVSQQIRALEKQYDTTLIDRAKRTFTLTSEGRALLETSRVILDALEDLSQRLQRLKVAAQGELRIATVYSIGLHELPPYLNLFRREYPGIEVRVEYLRSAQVYAAVSERRADIGLVAYPVVRRGLDVFVFWRDRLVLICPPSHPLARRRKLRLSSLAGERFIAFDPDLPTRKQIDRKLRDAGVRVKTMQEYDNIEILKKTVEIENAVSIVPLTTVRHEQAAGSLAVVEIEGADMWRPLGAIVRRRPAGSLAREKFLEMLREHDLGASLPPIPSKIKRK